MGVTHEHSAERKMKNSSVPINFESRKEQEERARKLLLLLRCVLGENGESGKVHFLRSVKCVTRLNAVNYAIGWVCPRWENVEGADNAAALDRPRNQTSYTASKEFHRVIPSESILSGVYVVRVSIAVRSHITEKTSSYHRFLQ